MWNGKIKMAVKKKTVIICAAALLVIVTILYMLAYRYLIERVEARVTDTTANGKASSVTTNIKYDDWSYKSDSLETAPYKGQIPAQESG